MGFRKRFISGGIFNSWKKHLLTAVVYLAMICLMCGCASAGDVANPENTVPPTTATESVIFPGTEPTTELPTEAAPTETADPTTEPAEEPSAEPATELSTEPTAKPTTEPATEPSAEPATEPVTEPVTEPTEDNARDYVANKNTHKFHYPNCSSVDSMKASNRWDYHGTREELISMGYDPCGRCHP